MKLDKLHSLILLIAFVTACSHRSTPTFGTKPPPKTNSEGVTITFACGHHEMHEFEEFAQSFHQIHPDVNVQVVSAEDVLGIDLGDPPPEDVIARLASSADVVGRWFGPSDTRSGAIMDLQPFVEADGSFQAEDFYPNMLRSFQWDGSAWALPVGAEAYLIFYNEELFDQASVAYPQAGWTLEDFLETAKQLTIRRGDEVIQWGFAPMMHVDAFIRLQGANLVDDTVEPPVPSLDTSEVAQALQWYTDLALVHGVSPASEAYDLQAYLGEMRRLRDEGKVAMWPDLSINQEYQSQAINLGLVPFPAGKIELNPIMPSGYWMSAGTAHPQESWLWLKALTKQPSLRQFGTAIPARRSVAEETGFWDGLAEETAVAYRYALEHAWTPWVEWRSPVLPEAVLPVLRGEEEVEEALAQSQQKALQEMVALAEITPQPVTIATPQPAAERTTITFVSLPTNLAAYQELARAFHRTHPNITVEVKSGAGLREMSESGDCFSWLFPHVAEEPFRQSVLDLQPLLESDPDFLLGDFYPQALDAFRWQGDLWGLPADIRLKLIYYNPSLFDQARVEYPSLDWSFDDFLKKAKLLTHGEGEEKQYGFVPLYEPDDLLFFAEGRGARLIDTTAQPPRPRFDAPQVVEAVRWYADLIREYDVRPIPAGSVSELNDQGRYSALIATDRAGMWMDFSGSRLFSSDQLPDVKLAPLPQGDAAFCRGYFISRNTSHPQVCWEWLKFLSKQLSPVEGLPPRRSLAESAQFRAQVGEETARVYRASLERIDDLSSPLYEQLPWLKRTFFWFYRAFDAILKGEDVESALSKAQRKADKYVDCLEREDGFVDEEVQSACMREADPHYQDLDEP